MQQLEHAQNRIHRCAYFMAHVGHELALGARGLLRGLGGACQFGDVGVSGDKTSVRHGCAAHLQRAAVAALSLEAVGLPPAGAVHDVLHDGLMLTGAVFAPHSVKTDHGFKTCDLAVKQ